MGILRAQLATSPHSGFGIEWDLNDGMLGIFGATGAGKTTLLKALAGLSPEHLIHLYHGRSKVSDNAIADNPCVYVSQHMSLLPHLNVADNLLAVVKYSQWPNNLSYNDVLDMLQITHLTEHKISQLSGGEVQLVSLARALLSGKPVMLLDEPFSALDYAQRQQQLRLLYQLQHTWGRRIIMVSHQLHDIAQFCDRLLYLKQHELCGYGKTASLINKVQANMHLPRFNCLPLSPTTGPTSFTLPNSDVELQAHHADTQATGKAILKASEITLSHSDLSHYFSNSLHVTVVQINTLDTCVLITVKHHSTLLVAQISQAQLAELALTPNQPINMYFGPL